MILRLTLAALLSLLVACGPTLRGDDDDATSDDDDATSDDDDATDDDDFADDDDDRDDDDFADDDDDRDDDDFADDDDDRDDDDAADDDDVDDDDVTDDDDVIADDDDVADDDDAADDDDSASGLPVGVECEEDGDCATGVCWDFNDYDMWCWGTLCSANCVTDLDCETAFAAAGAPSPAGSSCGFDGRCDPIGSGMGAWVCAAGSGGDTGWTPGP